MMINSKVELSLFDLTHEGAIAKNINYEEQLRRSVMASLLWEDSFYENGASIANRIALLVPKVKPDVVANIAIEAREKMHLRHMPLWLVRIMAKTPTHKKYVARTLSRIVQRADELSEFLSLYWADGKQPISSQVKKGLAAAFHKFDEYALAKYNRDNEIKLRDILFLTHPKPANEKQDLLWKKLINNTLAIPNTWEVILSTANSKGLNKTQAWEKVIDIWINDNKVMNHFAIIRNLRNIKEASVSKYHWDKIENCFDCSSWAKSNILPFRFIEAANHVPELESQLEKAMFCSLKYTKKLPGHTILLIDVSGSMENSIAKKSETSRMETAASLAMLLREVCNKVSIYCFSDGVMKIAPRRGFALLDSIKNSLMNLGTYTGKALMHINRVEDYDRIVVITDEQSHDSIPNPKTKGYFVNVGSYAKGIGYGKWIHIDGWSDSIVKYIVAMEYGHNKNMGNDNNETI